MQAFLDYVVKGLVDRPDAVNITSQERDGMTIYELRVHPTDMGKIIGRQGATVNAIRALLLVGSAKKGLRCALEVVDEEGNRGEHAERRHAGGDEGGGHSHSGGPRRPGGDRGGRGGGRGPRRSGDRGPRSGGGDRGPSRDRY